jgi:hypothetical protein
MMKTMDWKGDDREVQRPIWRSSNVTGGKEKIYEKISAVSGRLDRIQTALLLDTSQKR